MYQSILVIALRHAPVPVHQGTLLRLIMSGFQLFRWGYLMGPEVALWSRRDVLHLRRSFVVDRLPVALENAS